MLASELNMQPSQLSDEQLARQRRKMLRELERERRRRGGPEHLDYEHEELQENYQRQPRL